MGVSYETQLEVGGKESVGQCCSFFSLESRGVDCLSEFNVFVTNRDAKQIMVIFSGWAVIIGI